MSRHVRLDDQLYEHVETERREDESFSDAVNRLVGDRSLRDLRSVFDDDQVAEMREAVEGVGVEGVGVEGVGAEGRQ